MKISLRISLFLFLSIVITSCSKPSEELTRAEFLIESKPDSALQILRNLSPNKYKSPENKALYGLLMIEALDRLKLPISSDSLLDFSINHYSKHPDKDRLASCYLFKARAYTYRLQYEKALDFYMKTTDELQSTGNDLLNGRINLDLGDIFNVQGEYDSARSKYQLARHYFEERRLQPQAFYSLLNIGRTYHAAGEYKKAQQCYTQMLCKSKDSLQQGALYQEIGLNYYSNHQPDSAEKYLKQLINYPYISNNRAIRYYLLARLYFDKERIDSAFLLASQSFRYNPDIRTQRECYRIMTNCKFAQGVVKQVPFYMSHYVRLGDSLRKIDAQAKGTIIVSLHHTKSESKQNKLKLGIVICILFILILLACLLFRQLRRHSKNAIKQTEEKHIRRKAEIRKEPILMKREALKDKIEKIKSDKIQEKRPVSITERELQTRKIYENLLHLSDTEFFFNEMNSLFNNLVTKLKGRYKGLNEKELIWCCLYLLEVPTHDMLILLEYKTDNSLKRMKNRLSEKVSVENASLLGNLLFEIISED